MLKLTHGFCRYSRLTYENINHYSTVAQHFTNLNCKRKTCFTWHSQQSLLSPIVYSSVQWRSLANIKKRFRNNKLYIDSNAAKKPKLMSESLHPTLKHNSYGGQFEISEEENSSNEWLNQSSSLNKTPSNIPTDFRIWESVGNNNDKSNGFRFKVMSYNVLAQYLLECHPYLYKECTPRNLKWKVRSARIYDEILSISPDILCLQEVQISHLSNFYVKLEQLGYFGIYKQKTGHRHDGCAIYFKQCHFDMQDHITVEFYQPEMPILNRDNIGLMVKLIPKAAPCTPIVIATTHLLYNPKRTDVRLAQMQVLLAEIDRFAYDSNAKGTYLPIILTGDFNSSPDSAVIKLLDKGRISAGALRDNSDWRKIGVTDNCQHLSVYLNRHKGITADFSMIKIFNSDFTMNTPEDDTAQIPEYSGMFNSDSIRHPLKLSSVYNKTKSDGRFEATTFQDYWITVDYIYFSHCKSLKLLERLRLPSEVECDVLGRLPNDIYGSDHLALAAVFEIKPTMSSL
ncbi:protein angel homolog 2 isoform X2 [Nymphalis io]|uniref:protein angel homolog 2 isoform X2 n=1 Tax=Inachis io TaxID=171585 RepID=UPI00216A0A74|nr:protein angel homolog 2 isoform X2 [Nymphalis io]